MKLFRRLAPLMRLRPRRNRLGVMAHLWRRPAMAAAFSGYEVAVLASNRVELRTKYLAIVRASSRIGCPW